MGPLHKKYIFKAGEGYQPVGVHGGFTFFVGSCFEAPCRNFGEPAEKVGLAAGGTHTIHPVFRADKFGF